MSIGKRIFLLRSEKGLRQKDFASIMGVSASTIGMWETDKRQPDLDAIIKIAEYFNVTTDYLLGIENSKDTKTTMTIFGKPLSYKGSSVALESEMKKILSDSFDKLNSDNKFIIIGETKKLLKEQHHEEKTDGSEMIEKSIDESIQLIDIEKEVEEAIRTQKGNLDTKIG